MASGFNLTAQLNLQGPTNVASIVKNIKQQIGNITATVNIKVGGNTTGNLNKLTSSLTNLNNTLNNTSTNANSAAQAIRALGQAIGQANNPLNNLQQNLQNNAAAAAQLVTNLGTLRRNTQQCANQFEEFGRQSAIAVRRFAAMATVTSIIYKFGNSLDSAAKEFVEFNKELVKVAQVTDTNLSGLGGLVKEITGLSTNLGVASNDLIKVSSTLAQAGLSARDTEKALKALALSALAPSFDSLNDTVEGSIALMRQFNIGAGDLEGALGSVNAVAAKFAVEAGDIITAIQRTGGVFATASRGVSEGKDALNEFIAVFTSIRATTRESAETISTGLRTIFTRLQRKDTIDALKQFGVVLTDLEGKFVGPYEASRRLSEGLSKLDPRDLKFSQIVEELGGFRQIGKVIPLIQQFATAQEALKVAQQGQGSLAKDAAIAQESVANKMTKVREEFIALVRSIGESQGFQTFIKLTLDLTSSLIKLADAAKGIMPALLAIGTIRGAGAAVSFGRGFVGGLRRHEGGSIPRFASGGFVPGQGNGDTVPAMLTPGEFVIRKKAVQAIGADKLAGMNKYANGGIVDDLKRDPRVGAAVLEYGQKPSSKTFGVTIGNETKEIIGQKEGLNEKTNRSFMTAINEGVIRGVNYATRLLSKDLGVPATKINKKDQDSFLSGINEGTRGNLFEDVLRTMKAGPFGQTEAQRPFDFPDGLPSQLKDNYSTLPNKWIDAKASFETAQFTGDGSLQAKAQRQINNELGIVKNRTKGQSVQTDVLSKLNKDKSGGYSSSDIKKLTGINATDLIAQNRIVKKGSYYYLPETETQGFAKGGSPKDTVPALLTPGEFVINKKAASHIGLPTLHKMNHADKVQGFNRGGSVQRFARGGSAIPALDKASTSKLHSAIGSSVDAGGMFNNLMAKLDELDMPIEQNVAAIKAWTTSVLRGADETRAFDSAMKSAKYTKVNTPVVPPVSSFAGFGAKTSGMRGMAANLGLTGLARRMPKGNINPLASIGLMMGGGAAISSAASAFGGESTVTGRRIGSMGTNALNYGATGASIGSMIAPILGPLAPLGPLLGTLGGAVAGLTIGFFEAEKATKAFNLEATKKDLETQNERLAKNVTEYTTNRTSSNRQNALIQLGVSTSLANKVAPKTVTEGKNQTETEANLNTFSEEYSKTFTKPLEAAKGIVVADMIATGKTFNEISSSMNPSEFKDLATLVAKSNNSYIRMVAQQDLYVEKLKKEGKNKLASEAEKGFSKQRSAFLAKELANLAISESASVEAARAAKEAKKASIQLQKTMLSIDTSFEIVAQSLNKSSFDLSNIVSKAEEAMSGKANIRATGAEQNVNILSNPMAYSKQQRAGAVSSSSRMLGDMGPVAERLVSFGDSLDLLTSTTIKNAEKQGGDIDIGNTIRRTITDNIIGSFGETNISKGLIDTLNTSIDSAIKDAASNGQAVDWNVILEKITGPLKNVSEKASKALIEANKNYIDAVNKLGNITSNLVDIEYKKLDRENAFQSMKENSAISQKESLGIKTSYRDKINASMASVSRNAMLGGAAPTPQNLSGNIAAMQNQRKAMANQATQAINSGNLALGSKLTQNVQSLNTAIARTTDELIKLPQTLENSISNVLNEMQKRVGVLEATKSAGQGLAEKMVTSTPKEISDMNRSFAIMNNAIKGNVGTIQQSRDAQQAYFKALNEGKNIQEAVMEAQQAYANENKNALQMFDELVKVAGVSGPEIDQMKANMLEGMAKAQGNGENPILKNIIAQLRESPEDRAKRDPVLQALQTEAEMLRAMQQQAVTEATKLDDQSKKILETTANELIAGINAATAALNENLARAAQERGVEKTDAQAQINNQPILPAKDKAEVEKAQQQAMEQRLKDVVVGAVQLGFENAGNTPNSADTTVAQQEQQKAMDQRPEWQQKYTYRNKGGVVYASAGKLINFEPKGTDTIPAMLTPGEFVVNRKSTAQNLPLLKSINNGNDNNFAGSFKINKNKSGIDTRGRSTGVSNASRGGFVNYLAGGGMPFGNQKPDMAGNPQLQNTFFSNNSAGIDSRSAYFMQMGVNPMREALIRRMQGENITPKQIVDNRKAIRENFFKQRAEAIQKQLEPYNKLREANNSLFGFKKENIQDTEIRRKNIHYENGKWRDSQQKQTRLSRGTDTVPAMLSKGEYVVNKNATQKNIGLLENINRGYSNGGVIYRQNGGSVGPVAGSQSMDGLAATLNNFVQQMKEVLPSNVGVEGKHDVNVIINGAAILQNVLSGPLGELVKKSIEESFMRKNRQNEGS